MGYNTKSLSKAWLNWWQRRGQWRVEGPGVSVCLEGPAGCQQATSRDRSRARSLLAGSCASRGQSWGIKTVRSSCRGSAETNTTGIHLDTGSIPCLTQWVRESRIAVSCGVGCRHGSDLALLWPQVGSCSFNSTPSLGTSMCHRYGPKQKKKQKTAAQRRLVCLGSDLGQVGWNPEHPETQPALRQVCLESHSVEPQKYGDRSRRQCPWVHGTKMEILSGINLSFQGTKGHNKNNFYGNVVRLGCDDGCTTINKTINKINKIH